MSQLQIQVAESRKQLDQLQQKMAHGQLQTIQQQVRHIGGITVLAAEFPGVDGKVLRQAVEQCVSELPNAIVALATTDAEKVSIVVGVAKSLIKSFKAGELVNHIANQVGGKGGGKPELAQAGGNRPENLPQALASVATWVSERQK